MNPPRVAARPLRSPATSRFGRAEGAATSSSIGASISSSFSLRGSAVSGLRASGARSAFASARAGAASFFFSAFSGRAAALGGGRELRSAREGKVRPGGDHRDNDQDDDDGHDAPESHELRDRDYKNRSAVRSTPAWHSSGVSVFGGSGRRLWGEGSSAITSASTRASTSPRS